MERWNFPWLKLPALFVDVLAMRKFPTAVPSAAIAYVTNAALSMKAIVRAASTW